MEATDSDTVQIMSECLKLWRYVHRRLQLKTHRKITSKWVEMGILRIKEIQDIYFSEADTI